MTNNIVVNRITLFSADIDKTALFYGAIGINVEKTFHGWGPLYHYLDILKHNEQSLIFEIYSLPSGAVISPQGLGFDVENLSEIIGKLIEMKAPLVRPRILTEYPKFCDDCIYATFKDPDGRTVSLTQQSKVKLA